jgi:polynucleotide 5'-kinase involved in rRNA processing
MTAEQDFESEEGMGAKVLRHRTGMKPNIHPCIAKALSGRHILLIGSTGSGKTYAASYMAKFLDAFVAINTQEEREVSQVCQVQLESPDELQEALEEGYRRIEFTPSMDRDTAIEEVEVIREQLFEIGSEMKARSTELEIPFWITVFLDESQVYAPIMTHKDAESFFTRGRGYGIRGVAISRQPQELSKEIVNNVEYELIFKQGHYAELYFTRFKIPIEQHQEWINKEHHFLLYDKTSITRCLPVK